MISKHLGNILDITHDLGDHIWNGKDPSVFRMMLLKDFRGTERAAACAMIHDRILNRLPSDIQLLVVPSPLQDLEVGDTFRFLGDSGINNVVTDTDDVGCIGYQDEDTYYHEIPASTVVIKLKTGE
jgi:hypothetical protein|tara:strand:+ start:162 stop:539 length:378 start_codon:yes stop_codon:yes gene_type:complete